VLKNRTGRGINLENNIFEHYTINLTLFSFLFFFIFAGEFRGYLNSGPNRSYRDRQPASVHHRIVREHYTNYQFFDSASMLLKNILAKGQLGH